jgi:signal transduction histidine kinase
VINSSRFDERVGGGYKHRKIPRVKPCDNECAFVRSGRRPSPGILSITLLALTWLQLSAQVTTPTPAQPRMSHSRQVRRHLIKPDPSRPAMARLKEWQFLPEKPEDAPVGGVACGGDFNGDGFADVAVGEPKFDKGRGRTLIFYGSTNGLPATPDLIIEGTQEDRGFGKTVTMVGDLNGDGLDDLYIGGERVNGRNGAGLIFRGNSEGLIRSNAWSFDSAPNPVGDLNGDGFDDLAILAKLAGGMTHVLNHVLVTYGSPAGPQKQPGWASQEEKEETNFGGNIACAGDVNGDGYDDLLVGAINFTGRFRSGGKAYLYLGSPHGPSSKPDWTAEYPLPIRPPMDGDREMFFGWGLGSAGDVNHDGFDDVIVGACYADHDDTNEGLAFVYHGSRRGLNPEPDWWAEGNHAHALFGTSVNPAGDVNGDGFDDVVIGAPEAEGGQTREGVAVLYHGSRRGLAALPNWTMEGDHSNERFGTFVAGAGDVNGDGYADVLVFGPDREQRFGAIGLVKLGRVSLMYGGPGGLPPSHNWRVDKPFFTALQQRLNFYHGQYGSVVYWGPLVVSFGSIIGGFLLVQARLRRRLAVVIEKNRHLTLSQERTRLARDVHDNLGSQLTQIAIWTDIAKRSASNPVEWNEHLERISGFARSATNDISQLVWAMNPENDTVENFAAYLGDFVVEFLKPTSIEPDFQCPATLPAAGLAMECRAQLLAAVKEALNNVVRHSDAARVVIRLSLADGRLALDIEDDGRGFTPPAGNGPAPERSRGNGLRNLRSRMSELGGRCEIHSVPGQGTKIHLEVPLTCGGQKPGK